MALEKYHIYRLEQNTEILPFDAYQTATGFYEKCGLNYLSEKDKADHTRLMYFDLKTYCKAIN